jgi:hypothetical protein
LEARAPSLSLIVVTEEEKPLDAERGHDSAGVSARLERCVGPDLTEEKNRVTRNEATIRPE